MSVERSELNVERSAPKDAVFLSYAREDAAAARRIAEALRASGLEVWFDENELRGGDAWDAKIRKQIDACALFLPIISQHTQERGKGYFRLEWRLAVEQTRLMADNMVFLAPIVIDETAESGALVPPEFMRVQWMRLPGALPTPQFVEQVNRLLSKEPLDTARDRQGAPRPGSGQAGSPSTRLGTGGEQPRPRPAPHDERTALAKKSTPGAAVWISLGVVFAAVAVVFFITSRRESTDEAARRSAPPTSDAKSQTPEPARSPRAANKSVAVLAFADLSEARNSEYLSDGISEELLNVLAKIPELRVAARTSAFSFKGRNLPIPEIAQKLNVAYVVEGSVQRAGDRVKITAQLIKGDDGFHVWSDTFTRDMKDVFAIQEEIAGLIARHLSLKLGMATNAETRTAPTQNLAAYDAYLRGRALQMSANSNPTAAQRLYEEAVRLDPGYALAWARLAEVFIQMRRVGFDRGEQPAAKGREAALTALRLDPKLPEAHLALAGVRLTVDYDFEATRRELDETERLRPNDPGVPAIRAELEHARGRWDDRLAELTAQAVAADPLNASTSMLMGRILREIGRFAEADLMFDQSWKLAQDSANAFRERAALLRIWTGDVDGALAIHAGIPEDLRDTMLNHLGRAVALSWHGDRQRAIAAYEQTRAALTEASTSGPRNVHLIATYRIGELKAQLGQEGEAKKFFAEAVALAQRYASDYSDSVEAQGHLAIIHALRGEKSEALNAAAEAARRAARTNHAARIRSIRTVRAEVLGIFGEIDAAVAELREVYETGYAFGYGLRLDPRWAPLRGDAKFQQLMKEAEARADAQPRPKK